MKTPRRPRRELLTRLAWALGVTPLIAVGVALMITADAGLGPIDLATVGISNRLDVSLGVASFFLAGSLCAIGAVLGEPPGLGTVLGLPLFFPTLDAVAAIAPEPTGAPAFAQMLCGLAIAACGVSVIVAADVGVAPPEAVMIAVARHARRPIGPVRIVLDFVIGAFGVALGAKLGPGTLVVVLGFGPVLATLIPRAQTLVERSLRGLRKPGGPATLTSPASAPALRGSLTAGLRRRRSP